MRDTRPSIFGILGTSFVVACFQVCPVLPADSSSSSILGTSAVATCFAVGHMRDADAFSSPIIGASLLTTHVTLCPVF